MYEKKFHTHTNNSNKADKVLSHSIDARSCNRLCSEKKQYVLHILCVYF